MAATRPGAGERAAALTIQRGLLLEPIVESGE
jgi:hypothetical protein